MERAHLGKDLKRGDSIFGGRVFKKRKCSGSFPGLFSKQQRGLCDRTRVSKSKNNRKGGPRTNRPPGGL